MMKKTAYLLISLLLFFACTSEEIISENENNTEEETIVNNTELEGERKKLYELIMSYRKDNNLGVIPESKSLNLVAQTHVIDLEENQPVGGNCNLHSWSNKGKWSAVCYTSDHKQAQKMWDKPRELTSYPGNGYEISFGAKGYKVTAKSALDAWKKSSGHNNVIIEKNGWKNWNAIGIGIYGGYAVVWFGHEKDNN